MYILDTDLFSLTDREETAEGQRLRTRLATLRPDELLRPLSLLKSRCAAGWRGWLRLAL